MTHGRLKALLDGVLRDCDLDGRVRNDPVRFPLRYRGRADREVAAFLSASLAYGRVGLFCSVLERLLGIMGERPAEFVRGFSPRRDLRRLDGIKYRFSETSDLAAFLYLTGRALLAHGSLEAAFMPHYKKDDLHIGPGLSGFYRTLGDADTSPVYGRNLRPPGLRHLLASPEGGGAAKRACLFMRWMVRDEPPDMGLWRGIPKHKLVVPLDTHIARIGRCLGLTDRKTSGFRTALEITHGLALLDPDDPLRYDFALCHLGISGACSPVACGACPIPTARATRA